MLYHFDVKTGQLCMTQSAEEMATYLSGEYSHSPVMVCKAVAADFEDRGIVQEWPLAEFAKNLMIFSKEDIAKTKERYQTKADSDSPDLPLPIQCLIHLLQTYIETKQGSKTGFKIGCFFVERQSKNREINCRLAQNLITELQSSGSTRGVFQDVSQRREAIRKTTDVCGNFNCSSELRKIIKQGQKLERIETLLNKEGSSRFAEAAESLTRC